jgi:hypothetical protein
MKLQKILFLLVLCSLPIQLMAQDAQRTLTNTDIVNMTKSGIGEQTIVLTIQKSATKFDTSPEALIELKKQGVSDAILNAMLSAPSVVATPTDGAQQDCSQLLDRVLASVGTREKLSGVHSLRWTAKEIVNGPSGSSSFDAERVTLFPSSMYVSLQRPAGTSKAVVTPEFNYIASGKMTTGIPPSLIQELQSGLKLDPIYVSQHRDRYSCVLDGTEQVGNFSTAKLGIRGEGVEGLWNFDQVTGRLLRTAFATSTDQITADFSDWRAVDGIYVPFVRHIIKGAVTTDIIVNEYEINLATAASFFQAPADQPVAGLTLKVLQSESVPYVVQTNGGISTACNISGSTSTSMTSSTYGNTTYGNATSAPNLQMNCRSSDTTMRWSHVLNAMFVEASDGNAYIIACDRAWRWSKCVPLKAGDTFFARRTDKGFVVQSIDSKSKEQEATYSVLQSRSLHE